MTDAYSAATKMFKLGRLLYRSTSTIDRNFCYDSAGERWGWICSIPLCLPQVAEFQLLQGMTTKRLKLLQLLAGNQAHGISAIL